MTRKNKSYQTGTLKQLDNGVWVLRYRERDRKTGKFKSCREYLGRLKNKAEAKRKAEPIMSRVNFKNNADPSEPVNPIRRYTFKEFVETRWKNYQVRQQHSISTIYQRNAMMSKYLLPMLGDRYMDEVTPSDISDVMDKLHSEMTATSALSYYALLRLLFNLAHELDLIPSNPVRTRIHRPEPEKKEKPTVTPQQILQIADNLDHQERLFVILLGVTGFRLGEAQSLRWQDFNEDKGAITVHHTIWRGHLKPPKTKGSKATIHLHPYVAEMLKEHKRNSNFQQPDDFIFCRPTGDYLPEQSLRTHLYKAMEMAEIKRQKSQYGFHLIRHSVATLLYQATRDVRLVQSVLRHSNLNTTSIYVHSTDEIGVEASEALTKMLFGENLLQIASQESTMVS